MIFVNHANDLLKFFTQGFDESLEKVKELQPDFPAWMIVPPPRVAEFMAMLSGSSSRSTMTPPNDKPSRK